MREGAFAVTGIYVTVGEHERATILKVLRRLLVGADIEFDGMEKPIPVIQTEMRGPIERFCATPIDF